MLKSILYYLLLLTTSFRFADMIYVLSRESTNLPIPVIISTCALVLYGIVMVFYRFVAPVRMKQLVNFYVIQTAIVCFNMVFVAVACPLRINWAETLLIGTFLDLLVNGGLIYVCVKRIRNVGFQAARTDHRINV